MGAADETLNPEPSILNPIPQTFVAPIGPVSALQAFFQSSLLDASLSASRLTVGAQLQPPLLAPPAKNVTFFGFGEMGFVPVRTELFRVQGLGFMV